MAVVWIPSLLRDLTHGRDTIAVQGKTVAEVLEAMEQAYPGVRNRLCDENGLRKGIAVAVDTQIARLGLAEPVGEASEVHFLPAVGGGAIRQPRLEDETPRSEY
jgi:molybdopterin synthase sulfur carrier subunit